MFNGVQKWAGQRKPRTRGFLTIMRYTNPHTHSLTPRPTGAKKSTGGVPPSPAASAARGMTPSHGRRTPFSRRSADRSGHWSAASAVPEKRGRAGRRRGLPGHGPLDPHWTTSRDPVSSKPGFPRPLNPSYVRETAALVRRDSCSKREATGIAAAAAVTISSGRQQAAAAAAAVAVSSQLSVGNVGLKDLLLSNDEDDVMTAAASGCRSQHGGGDSGPPTETTHGVASSSSQRADCEETGAVLAKTDQPDSSTAKHPTHHGGAGGRAQSGGSKAPAVLLMSLLSRNRGNDDDDDDVMDDVMGDDVARQAAALAAGDGHSVEQPVRNHLLRVGPHT